MPFYVLIETFECIKCSNANALEIVKLSSSLLVQSSQVDLSLALSLIISTPTPVTRNSSNLA